MTTTCTPVSGTQFSLGPTTVQCTATDSLGRTAVCSFKVTLSRETLGATRFLAFGDSVTEGQNGLAESLVAPAPQFVDDANSYPTKLRASLQSSFPDQGISVVNAGVGGEFVEVGLVRLRDHALPENNPDAVLLLDGYNNLLNGCPASKDSNTPTCGAAINVVYQTLDQCVRTALAAPSVRYVFLSKLTPPGPAGGSPDRRISPDAIDKANGLIVSVAASEHVTLVDPFPLFVGHESQYVEVDGLHLSPAGNQVLAGAFFSSITSVIPETFVPVAAQIPGTPRGRGAWPAWFRAPSPNQR